MSVGLGMGGGSDCEGVRMVWLLIWVFDDGWFGDGRLGLGCRGGVGGQEAGESMAELMICD